MVTKDLPIWNLTDFYPSNDSKEFENDLSDLKLKIINFSKKYKGKLKDFIPSKISSVISDFENIEELIGKIKSYIFLFYCTDQLNSKKTTFYQMVQEKLKVLESQLLFFTIELNKIDEKLFKSTEKSKYYVWIKNLRKYKKYQKSETTEKILLDKSTTSSNAWIRLFDETMARLRFNFRKKSLNESEILNLLSSPNKSKRKEASISFATKLKENIHLFTMITNVLSKDLQIENKIRGFKKPDDSRHLGNQVDAEDVKCLSETVKKNYKNLSHRYYHYKAKKFKVKKLDYWDRNAPYPNQSNQNIDWNEAKDIVTKSYKRFDPRISKIVEMFFDKSWIHASVIDGKTSGAFAHPTVPSCHPYILLNYQNKTRDVMTLAHELGHGVHQYLANSNGLLLSDTPLTLAETASVFGEMLTFKFLLENSKSIEQRKTILRSKIEDMINTVVRQISFYEFEKQIHEKRQLSELSVNDINNIWMSTQKDSLGPSIKFDKNYKYFWAYIPHFIHSPFYVYAYAFGDCLVNSLYSKYDNGHVNFNDLYIDLLKAGGTKHYSNLLEQFDLDAKDTSFWQGGLNIIENLINELEKLD